MNLFIGNLPSMTTEGDLCALLRLSQRDAPRRLRIFKKADRAGRTLRFGIVHVETDADLRKLLDRNRSAELQGQRLDVREYLSRAAGNERRAIDWRSRPWPHAERRVSERRANP
ncbi:MAG: RNA-binding protein [Gammaproteobacteria bacterium]|nr:RNA-binding protein [Gammaproteobacteria bacterium]